MTTDQKRTPKTIPSISGTGTNADPMASLRAKLKTTDSEIRNYVVALE